MHCLKWLTLFCSVAGIVVVVVAVAAMLMVVLIVLAFTVAGLKSSFLFWQLDFQHRTPMISAILHQLFRIGRGRLSGLIFQKNWLLVGFRCCCCCCFCWLLFILLCYFCCGGHHVRWWQYNRYVVVFTLLALTHTLRMITTDRHALITYFYFITLH